MGVEAIADEVGEGTEVVGKRAHMDATGLYNTTGKRQGPDETAGASLGTGANGMWQLGLPRFTEQKRRYPYTHVCTERSSDEVEQQGR